MRDGDLRGLGSFCAGVTWIGLIGAIFSGFSVDMYRRSDSMERFFPMFAAALLGIGGVMGLCVWWETVKFGMEDGEPSLNALRRRITWFMTVAVVALSLGAGLLIYSLIHTIASNSPGY